MFCIGATQSREACTKASTEVARIIFSPAPTGSVSGSSAVQRMASTRSGEPPFTPTRSAAVPASEMTGPWRVLRTFRRTGSLRPLTRISSSAVLKAAHPVGVWYCAASPAFRRSRYRSWTSGPVLVKPQAMSAFWPNTMEGTPGMVAPAAFRPGASRRAKYHSAGALSLRCGSLASKGAPVVVRLPASTQLLEPAPSTPEGGACSGRLSQAWVALPAPIFSSRYRVETSAMAAGGSPGYGGISSWTRCIGKVKARRMRCSSLFQLPPRSQAIMMAQARLSTGVQSSGCRPRIRYSGGRAPSAWRSTALMPAA